MATSLFDRDGLKNFVAAGEGAPPPVFVGRKKAIGDIEAAARRAWKPGAASHGEPKATRIVYGAPGAGKSPPRSGRLQRAPGLGPAVGPLGDVRRGRDEER
ncbi:MAG: hypothetical protein OXN84_13675 [Albidovulum sp.]|nr:hypothetical protein [Albidovulum sp.]